MKYKIYKKFSVISNPFFIFLSLYLITIFIVSPWGNFSVNDDWQFYTHVRYFLEGDFRKNSLIDAAFILQGFIALYWVKIFGLSFTSIKLLTVLFSVIFFYGFYKTLNLLKINTKLILVSLLCLLIEPFIITSSLSFMTEIYFLTFMIWSLYLFLLGINSDSKKKPLYLILGIFIGSLSLLIRQFGIVLGISYLVYFLIYQKLPYKKLIFSLTTLILFSLFTYINYSFPQNLGNYGSKSERISNLISNLGDLFYKITLIPKYIPYLLFFLSLIFINFKVKTNFKKLILLALPFSFVIYINDIFNLKNVFHIECLYCETNFTPEFSLTDNQYTKFLISTFFGFLISKVIFFIQENKSAFRLDKFLNDPNKFILSLVTIGMLSVILVVDSFYDRYFINFDVTLILLLSYLLNKINLNFRLSLITFLPFYFIILFINLDYYNSINLKWNQGSEILRLTNYQMNSQVYVSGPFSRFQNANERDRDELLSPVKLGEQKCFVLRYVENSKNKYFYKNPVFLNRSNNMKIPKIENNKENIVLKNEYSSPLFNLLGQKTYILSICNKEIINKYNLVTTSMN